jgi:nitroreductase
LDKPVEHNKLKKCLEAARLSPSARNSQPWSVVVEETAKLIPTTSKLAESQIYARGDLGDFVLSLTLEAESLGIGASRLGLFDRPHLFEFLDIPREKNIFLIIAAGYPKSDKVRSKEPKPLEDIKRFV